MKSFPISKRDLQNLTVLARIHLSSQRERAQSRISFDASVITRKVYRLFQLAMESA